MATPDLDLMTVLTLERIEDNIFRGLSPKTPRQTVFGGQVLGQSLMATGRTVPSDRFVHSLHAYFLLPGDPNVPIVYVVERIRDGRSFTTRRVLAQQHGRPIFQMSCSFQVLEDGLDHQDTMPAVAPPNSLSQPATEPDGWTSPASGSTGVELVPAASSDGSSNDGLRVWLRSAAPLPEEPLVHAAVLAYASDLTLLTATQVRQPHRFDAPNMQVASLDHAMWFHREFRADEWLLHDQVSASASHARGMGQGKVFTADGRLVATTTQEGLTRTHPAAALTEA